MRLIDRFRPAKAYERGFNEAKASGASVLMSMFGSPDAERILPTYINSVGAYQESGVVFGVILARLMLFSEAEFKFQNLADKTLFGTPDLGILETPWPNGSTGELLARMEQDASIAGNAYIRDAGTQLERLRPDRVTVVSESVDDAEGRDLRVLLGYLYDRPGCDGEPPEFYTPDEVTHWSPIPDPLHAFLGMSWLSVVLREVDADRQMTDYKRAYLENAATPNLVLRYQQALGDDKIERIRDMMHARHGGVGNAFKTLVLDAGADLTTVGNSFEQMAYAAVQAAGENRIAVAAGVPAIVAGLKEGMDAATYSNYGQAMRRFADLTMRPLWRSACAALEKFVNVPAGARLWFDTTGIAALREGEQERATTMQTLAAAASTLITAGFTPESVRASLAASDVSLLQHSGLVSVQLQAPGSTPTAAMPARSEPDDQGGSTTVHVPVSVTLPRGEAPVVNVEPSRVVVREVAAPVIPAPVVNVTNEVQPAPVTVAQPKATYTETTVKRDRKGEVSGSTAVTQIVED